MALSLPPARCASFVSPVYSIQMGLQGVSLEMLELLKELRKKVVIGFVGGSDLVKITEQLSVSGHNGKCELPAPLST